MPVSLIAIWAPAPRSGKTSLAQIITEDFPQFEIRSFADPVKAMAHALLDHAAIGEREISEALYGNKTAGIFGLPGSPTGRQLLAGIGNGFGRNMNPEFWASLMERRLWRDLRPTVIDDLRFPEELNMVRRCGGQVWHVIRPNLEPLAHPLCTPDVDLINDGTLDDMRRKAAAILAPQLGGA